MRPNVDKNWNLILGDDGKVDWIPNKIRQGNTPEGRSLDFPMTLVEQYPERALEYEWVSAQHKDMALQILANPDPDSSEYPFLETV